MSEQCVVNLTFAYSVDDWKRVLRLADSRKRHSWAEWLFTLLYVLFAGYELLLGINLLQLYFISGNLLTDAVRNLTYGAIWLFWALLLWTDPLRALRHWRQLRKWPRERPKTYEFTFISESAVFRTASEHTLAEVKVSWNAFSRLMENKDVMLLNLKDDGFWALPKRHFATQDDLDMFRRIAQEGIDAGKTKVV